jgi:hypothetical protein
MNNIADQVSKYLESILNVEDNLFKILLADTESNYDPIILTPNNYNIGMLSNFLEWNRQLTISLLKQIVITSATGKFIDFILHKHCDIVRLENESDEDYKTRASNYIIAPKISPASIIHYTKKFSRPGIPKIFSGSLDSAFSDVCFASYYNKTIINDPNSVYNQWNIVPAITRSVASSVYFFTLELENLTSGEIPELIDTVNRWKASGIDYEVRVVYQ